MSSVTALTPGVAAVVLLAGVLHAVWNAIVAKIEDKALTFGLIGAVSTVVAVALLPLSGLPRSAAFGYVLISAVLHLVYDYALLRSYRLGDFGRVYPLARGTSPLVVALGGWLLAGEALGAREWAGVLTVAAGLIAVVFAAGRLHRTDTRATSAALFTGVMIASYTVVDGLGVRRAHNPVGYLALGFVLQGPILVLVAWLMLRGRLRREQLRAVPSGVAAGILSMLAYGLVLWAQTRAALALVSALRETSVISASLIAALVFHEPFGRRRVLPAVVVAAGILLICA
jgi:drug/metabolite transporter (DMT)-like permease